MDKATTLKRYEIVSRYVNNQTDADWNRLVIAILEETEIDIELNRAIDSLDKMNSVAMKYRQNGNFHDAKYRIRKILSTYDRSYKPVCDVCAIKAGYVDEDGESPTALLLENSKGEIKCADCGDEALYEIEKHDLHIDSLHDAQAHCNCGWSITCTGERTREYIEQEYKRHLL